MLTRILIVTVLSVLASACDNAVSRLDAEARICERALEIGELELAEENCQRALGEAGDNVLTPQVRSERLYRLGRIKRQLSKYLEAAELINQSLTLELTLSGSDSPRVASRRLEKALILAGQGQWQAGALLLEQTVPVATRFNEKEQASLVNVLQHYALLLQKNQQIEQASRLRAAAASLKKEQSRLQ